MTLYVLKMYPRFSETFVLFELLGLERRGRRLHIVSLRKPDDGRFHEALARLEAGVTYLPEHVRCAPGAYLSAQARALRRAPRALGRTLRSAIRHGPEARQAWWRAPLVAELALARGAERLHAHFASLPAVTAMYAAELAALPFSFTAHAKDIFCDARPRALLRELLCAARRVVTVSDYNAAFLRSLAGGALPPERVVRVYNGVDLERFRPAPERQSEAPLVLAVGRLVEKKGFVHLVDACALLHEQGVRFRCEIVGKGPCQAELEARIAEHHLQGMVALLGPLPGEVVAEKLREAAVVAAPCVRARDGNQDGLPTVILEAMAAGRPVVSTPVSGIPEAVADGVTGRLVPPGDARALAQALAALLRDEGARARMGREGRRRAEHLFDLERNVAELERYLCQAESGAGPLAPGLERVRAGVP